MRKLIIRDWNKMPYGEAWNRQETLLQQMVEKKLQNRDKNSTAPEEVPINYLIFTEHPPVITLGKSGKKEHLLVRESFLKEQGIEFYQTNRGGDITYHGPGQIVGYPILDLEQFFTDIHRYLRTLEEVIICTLAVYGIKAGRSKNETGVWIDPEHPQKARKICAMGVRCSRWVTMHGWALNVNTNLSHFDYIIPCGIRNKAVTSMEKELGRKINMEEVKSFLAENFIKLFDARIIEKEASPFQG